MAKNVVAQALGGDKKVLDDVNTVADVKEALGLVGSYTASVNAETASDDEELADGDFVSFAQAVKGG